MEHEHARFGEGSGCGCRGTFGRVVHHVYIFFFHTPNLLFEEGRQRFTHVNVILIVCIYFEVVHVLQGS